MYLLEIVYFAVGIVVTIAPVWASAQDVFNSIESEALSARQGDWDLCRWIEGHNLKGDKNWTQARNEIWHPRKIEYLDFNTIKTLQQSRLQVATHPEIKSPVLIKTITSSSEISSLEQEVEIYRLLHGTGATPEFLGHVTKNGQIIGFISEYIDEDPIVRQKHLKNCLDTLRVFHGRGIAHADAHDANCLIRKDGTAVLIDFELSLETWSHAEFERDLEIMSRCIWEFSESS